MWLIIGGVFIAILTLFLIGVIIKIDNDLTQKESETYINSSLDDKEKHNIDDI